MFVNKPYIMKVLVLFLIFLLNSSLPIFSVTAVQLGIESCWRHTLSASISSRGRFYGESFGTCLHCLHAFSIGIYRRQTTHIPAHAYIIGNANTLNTQITLWGYHLRFAFILPLDSQTSIETTRSVAWWESDATSKTETSSPPAEKACWKGQRGGTILFHRK